VCSTSKFENALAPCTLALLHSCTSSLGLLLSCFLSCSPVHLLMYSLTLVLSDSRALLLSCSRVSVSFFFILSHTPYSFACSIVARCRCVGQQHAEVEPKCRYMCVLPSP
jgi:hypothetical protein